MEKNYCKLMNKVIVFIFSFTVFTTYSQDDLFAEIDTLKIVNLESTKLASKGEFAFGFNLVGVF